MSKQTLHRKRHQIGALRGWFCHYCGVQLTCHCIPRREGEQATLDHLVPKSLGGRDTRDNLVLACKPCNQAKGSAALPIAKHGGGVTVGARKYIASMAGGVG